MLTEDQQAVADALTRAVIARRPPTPKPSTDPYADLAASYAEDTEGEAARPGTDVTPKTPTDNAEGEQDSRARDRYEDGIDEDRFGFHLEGDRRYE